MPKQKRLDSVWRDSGNKLIRAGFPKVVLGYNSVTKLGTAGPPLVSSLPRAYIPYSDEILPT
jgi:hypothetical protein